MTASDADVVMAGAGSASFASHPAVQHACAVTGMQLVHHAEVDSTQDVAQAMLAEGTALPFVVVADRQTSGRGRRGRIWVDDVNGPNGPANLAVTTAVDMPAAAPGVVPLAVGIAVAEAIRAVAGRAGLEVALKWPNDVMIDAKKVAGVLVDRLTGARDVAVIGCGIDVDWRGVARADDAGSWISVAEAVGADVERADLLAQLLVCLERWLGYVARDTDSVLATYRPTCVTLGQHVAVSRGGQEATGQGKEATLRGTARDVDAAGRLIVDTVRGFVPVAAGDVVHVR